MQENEKYQIVNREGQNLLKSSCEEIFNYDYPVVGFRDREQEICGCVEGENIVYFEEDYEWMFFIPQRDLVILKKDETYGIKDFQGNIVIPFEYQHISYNSYYDTYHIMDQKGEESEIDADDFTGKKDGKEKKIYIYNVCDHQECYKEVGSQAISYTTGVPAMIGTALVVSGQWKAPGVFTVEEFDPGPYMEMLNKYGLPWVVEENPRLVE